jgi:hypothetical protein
MQASSSALLSGVKMAKCNSANEYQWFEAVGTHIFAPFTGVTATDVCLLVATNNVPGDVDTGACTSGGFTNVLSYNVGSSGTISPSDKLGGYVSDVSTGYTYAQNDTLDGSNSRWDWTKG